MRTEAPAGREGPKCWPTLSLPLVAASAGLILKYLPTTMAMAPTLSTLKCKRFVFVVLPFLFFFFVSFLLKCARTHLPSLQSGDYVLQVELDGMPIQNSPFKLLVRSPRADAASSSLVSPDGSSTSMTLAEGRARFTVQARDRFGHNHTQVLLCFLLRLALRFWSLTTWAWQGGQKVEANLLIRCTVEDNGDGTYSVSYLPSSEPHQQMFLDITLDGRRLGGSPSAPFSCWLSE